MALLKHNHQDKSQSLINFKAVKAITPKDNNVSNVNCNKRKNIKKFVPVCKIIKIEEYTDNSILEQDVEDKSSSNRTKHDDPLRTQKSGMMNLQTARNEEVRELDMSDTVWNEDITCSLDHTNVFTLPESNRMETICESYQTEKLTAMYFIKAIELLTNEDSSTESRYDDVTVIKLLTNEDSSTESRYDDVPAIELLTHEDSSTESRYDDVPAIKLLTNEDSSTESRYDDVPAIELLTNEDSSTESRYDNIPANELLTNEDLSTESKYDDIPAFDRLCSNERNLLEQRPHCNVSDNQILTNYDNHEIDLQQPQWLPNEISFDEGFELNLQDVYDSMFEDEPLIHFMGINEFYYANSGYTNDELEWFKRDLNCIQQLSLLPPVANDEQCENTEPESQREIQTIETKWEQNINGVVIGECREPKQTMMKQSIQDPPPIRPASVVVYTIDGQMCELNLMRGRPQTFKSYESMVLSDYATINNTMTLADEIMFGNTFPPELDRMSENNFKNDMKKLMTQIKRKIGTIDADSLVDDLKFYELEKNFLQCDYYCKAYLNAKLQQVNVILQRCLNMELSILTFVKNPHILSTINKLASQTDSKAKILQNISRVLVKKIKKLLPLEKCKTFTEAFQKRRDRFNEAIGHLTEYVDICLLTKEPHYVPSKENVRVKRKAKVKK